MANIEMTDDSGPSPSSFPEYLLRISVDTPPSVSSFSATIFALQDSLPGLVSGSWSNTFFPVDIIVDAQLEGQTQGSEREKKLRAFLDISTRERAAITRIGEFEEFQDDWTRSRLYVNGRPVSRASEALLEEHDWVWPSPSIQMWDDSP